MGKRTRRRFQYSLAALLTVVFYIGLSTGLYHAWGWYQGKIPPRRLRGHDSPLLCSAVSPDGRFAVSVDTANVLILWSLHLNSALKRITVPSMNMWHWSRAWCLAGGRRLVTCDGSELILWDARAGKILRRAPLKTRALEVSPDSELVLWADGNGSLHLCELESGAERLSLPAPPGSAEIEQLAFLPDGRRAVSIEKGGTVRLWDLSGTESPAVLAEKQGFIRSMAFSSDGRELLLAGVEVEPVEAAGANRGEGEVRVTHFWQFLDLAGRKKARKLPTIRNYHEAEICALSPDGRRIFAGGFDGTILVHDAVTGRQLRRFPGRLAGLNVEGVRSVAGTVRVSFLPGGRQALTPDHDGTIWIIDTLPSLWPVLLTSAAALLFFVFLLAAEKISGRKDLHWAGILGLTLCILTSIFCMAGPLAAVGTALALAVGITVTLLVLRRARKTASKTLPPPREVE